MLEARGLREMGGGMEIPDSTLGQMLKAVFYPSAYLDALRERADRDARWEPPMHMWRTAIGVCTLGTLIFGLTAGLAVGDWPYYQAAAFFALTYALAWAVFFALFVSCFPRPAWLSRHIAVVVLLFGEMLFEVGALLNLIFWLTNWLSRAQAIQFNLAWVLLADVTMGVVFVGLLKHGHIPVGRPLLLWLLFNAVLIVLGIFLLSWLGPSVNGGYTADPLLPFS